MKKTVIIPIICALFLASTSLLAVNLEQFISREDAAFNVPGSFMSVGSDGNVYLASNAYIQRISPDGKERKGSAIVYSTMNAAANKNGIMASANAHFARAINFYTPDFVNFAKVGDLLANDQLQWFCPGDVQAGETDFYGFEQNRSRILRISEEGKMISGHPVDAAGEDFARTIPRLRVSEEAKIFYVASNYGTLYAINFDGTLRYKMENSGLGGNIWDWYGRAFHAEPDGTLYVMAHNDNRIFIYDKDSNQIGIITLLFGEQKGRISWMERYKDEIYIKRMNSITLFEVYDINTGALKRVVDADIEIFNVSFPSYVWLAGSDVPLTISLKSGNRTINPQWKSAIRLFNDSKWIELKIENGHVKVPNNAVGIYQLKVYGGSDYAVEEFIEIRKENATINGTVLTQNNRIYWGQSENIPVKVKFREAANAPTQVAIELRDESGTAVIRGNVTVNNGEATTGITSAQLSKLATGRYTLIASANNANIMEQPIILGKGFKNKNPFSIVQFGDYGTPLWQDMWGGSTTKVPDLLPRYLSRAEYLGVNLFVDRLGHHLGYVDTNRNVDGVLNALKSRIEQDGNSVPMEKMSVELPLQQSLAALSANGIEEEAILLYMDAGLPRGTGHDARSDEQFATAITNVTRALKGYPGFKGWVWAANWWMDPGTAYRSLTPEKRAEYDAAMKKMQETGEWNAVIEEVSNIYINWPIEADKFFNSVLQKEAPGLINGMTGPYRQPYLIPSITFNNAKEIDLHYQAEQLQPPQSVVHNVDYYKREGKRSVVHPEFWNDSGTGDFIYNSLFQAMMRGVDGIGYSGDPMGWTGGIKSDVRGTSAGTLSVYRNLFEVAGMYGNWSTQLKNKDKIAIPVSTRQLRVEQWSSHGGAYFAALFEAWNSCLYAKRTAKFVFAEDIAPGVLRSFDAVLLVNQTVEWDPNIARGLGEALTARIPIFADSSCRESLVTRAIKLDVDFTKVAREPHIMQDDGSYLRLPNYFRENAKVLNAAFSNIAPIMECDNYDIMMSERTSGNAKYIWVVRNDMLDLSSGDMWKFGLTMASHTPQAVDLTLSANGMAVYDVFSFAELSKSVNNKLAIEADLMSAPARLYAVLPSPIGRIVLRANENAAFGQDYAFSVAVQTAQGGAFNTSFPIKYRLLDANGNVLLEENTFTAINGTLTKQITLPLNVKTNAVKLVAVELISGKEAAIDIALTNRRALTFAGADTVTGAVAPNKNVIGVDVGHFTKIDDYFGAHLKSIVIADNGASALLNAMNYDNNLYNIDLNTGALKWSSRIGHHFAYAPLEVDGGFAVQGFDLNSAENYHLYTLDGNGNALSKFATFGFPKRATQWATAAILLDKLNNFAVAPNKSFVAASGDFGLIVWDGDGRELWRKEWWKEERKRAYLSALDNDKLVLMEGMTATCYNAKDGAVLWQHTFANTGNIEFMVRAANADVLAFYANTLGGRVYIIKDGKLTNTLDTYADMLALSPSGDSLVATNNYQLRCYNTAEGIVWSYNSADNARNPAFSANGDKIAVSDDLGIMTVLARADGTVLYTEDLRGLSAFAWLEGGSLIAATWHGLVTRYDNNFNKSWSTVLKAAPTKSFDPKRQENIPIVKADKFGNAATQVNTDTENNLLKQVYTQIVPIFDPNSWRTLEHNQALLYDGDLTPQAEPWIEWINIQMVDSGWVGRLTIQFDTFSTQLNITGMTFYEDKDHPESWLRDMRLEWWDPVEEVWQLGPYMLSDAAVHTHMFDVPINASKFRLVSTGGGSWPVGNIRLSELVLHGSVGSASHPDVVAKRPLAVLFDEKDSDLLPGTVMGGGNYIIKYDDSFTGNKSIAMTAAGGAGGVYHSNYGGHVVPNWKFEIVANPELGQYRYLQFAVKSLSKDTTQIGIELNGVYLAFGNNSDIFAIGTPYVISPDIPQEWTTVRVDLWAFRGGRDFIINNLRVGSAGGGSAFDQIVLARTLDDLPPETENGYH